jgi:membrane associated rhomboid family serine protease
MWVRRGGVSSRETDARTWRPRGGLSWSSVPRTVPVTATMVTATTVLSAASAVPGRSRSLVAEVARYHAADLAAGRWWRLLGSALLPQSLLQWVWTAAVACTLFVMLEAAIGSQRMAILLAASHVGPTLVIAGWAYAAGDRAVLDVPDFGTSCLIMGVAGALLWLRRSRILLVGLLIIMSGDMLLNLPMTVLEHVIAIAIGVASVLSLRASSGSRVSRSYRIAQPATASTSWRSLPTRAMEIK